MRPLCFGLALLAAFPWLLVAQEACGPSGSGIWHCVQGSGDAVVVLNAVARLTSRTWEPLIPALASHARVVTFDRPGLARSEPGPTPRSPSRIAKELSELLGEIQASPPFVLVGHSAGGYALLRFAVMFPERVRGVILLDTPHPEFERRRLELLSAEDRATRHRALSTSRSAAPTAVQQEYAGAAIEGELDFAGFPRDVPLFVVSADSQDFGAPSASDEHRRLWMELQGRWGELSRRFRLVVAEGSGHMVHHDRPDTVLRAVKSLVPGGSF